MGTCAKPLWRHRHVIGRRNRKFSQWRNAGETPASRSGDGDFGGDVGEGVGGVFYVLFGEEGSEGETGGADRAGAEGLVREWGAVEAGTGEDAVLGFEDHGEFVGVEA